MMKARVVQIFILLNLFTLTLHASDRVQFHSNLLLRYDRQEFPEIPPRATVERYRIQWRPSLLFLLSPEVELGIGAEANWIDESDEDVQPPRFPEFHTPLFDRDNFKRDAVVLNLAFVKYSPSPNLQILGGKFENPFAVTELVWDNDLHPNGAVISTSFETAQGGFRFTGRVGDFYASHYLHDRTNVIAVQGVAQATAGPGRFTFSAAYYDHNVDDLDVPLLRTNTRNGNELANDYNLMDLIARARWSFTVPITAQIDYVKNFAADNFIALAPGNGDDAYMAEFLIGQLQQPFGFRAGYSYHWVESDAVLAAYDIDEWWFPTRGEGYRIHGGILPWKQFAFEVAYINQHLIDQSPRFKRWLVSAEINWP
ncbi:putative porin [bacterium]|nr:putative porin [bacterium]